MNRFYTIALFFLCLSWRHADARQQELVNQELLQNHWTARWITCPEIAPRDYGVYHFRKTFDIPAIPEKFIINVTADNRYRLFVNGKAVSSGPARGDLYNWYFETVDIAPFLVSGKNVIAALVWNMGTYAPVAQISNQTGFLLQGNSEKEQLVNTNNSWKVLTDKAYKPCSTDNGARLKAYMVIGPGDEVDGALYPWNWEKGEFDDSSWTHSSEMASPASLGYGTDNLWTLVPRNIPQMEESLQRLKEVRRTDGVPVSQAFLNGKESLTIPANTKVSILLDQSYNTVAYPQLLVSKGKGASIKLSYAETLFDNNGRKGNRNVVEGKELIGNYDIFKPDGGRHRLFRPLWLRTYRYLQLDIMTSEEPLEIEDLYGMYTGYPFKENAHFSSDDASLEEIWKVGWRTARLCAGETYYDCPYYEQLQYEADTRIQALISMYVAGDDRLVRKALLDFHHSRVPEGLTQGRYPSNRLQVIPPFSLWWISMVHDYWMLRKDDAFIEQFLMGMMSVLDWYEKQIDQEKKMLGPMKWWNFVDYTDVFPNGVPDGATDGNSSVITLQYVYTLQQAAKIFEYYHKSVAAQHYKNLAAELAVGTYQQCFDIQKGVMANTPEKNAYSQHASIMGILTEAIPTAAHKKTMGRVLNDSSLGPATFYYRFYLTQAMKKAGMADLYYDHLTPWRDMLKTGLTTFAEKPDPARSDCHAWSASPNYDFLATICGVMPSAPGFAKVRIEPALGELKQVNAVIPHPKGEIKVFLKRTNKKGLEARVTLPADVQGEFIWDNKKVTLKAGEQKFSI
ncbi:alpha-L-rhamnosidase-related protein [Olivibacter domesticus]|uniref:Alpha-L-rhamnosidase N-terminal domain-containing protein n=1 Tax=Olivibacter domesticus TaxID=407022 RepID=A0A1H7XZ62_OLID1|nr:alpha-L-rhamnosidase C-terminal domain-containing protein [Olivibacter domesticus]SEM39003.1 Alpha-L-rhamnosidase N-terminal domain-containing protein [Olivibacter domesticus]